MVYLYSDLDLFSQREKGDFSKFYKIASAVLKLVINCVVLQWLCGVKDIAELWNSGVNTAHFPTATVSLDSGIYCRIYKIISVLSVGLILVYLIC